MKHSHDLRPEHPHDLLIGHRHVTLRDFLVLYHMIGLNIPHRQKQGPQAVLISVQILERDILIDAFMNRLSPHQFLNLMLASQRMTTDHVSDQLVAAGIDPVRLQFPLLHIVADRPGIVDILPVSNDKAVIHGLHILHGVDVLAFQRIHNLLLGKAKAVTVIIAGNGAGFQVIQIGKQRVFGNSRHAGNDSPEKAGIFFKCTMEQLAAGSNHLIPVTVCVCLQKRRVIFVQKNDRLCMMMPVQQPAKCLNCNPGIFCVPLSE